MSVLLGSSLMSIAATARPAQAFLAQLVTGSPPGGWVLHDLVIGAATCAAVIAAAALGLGGVAAALDSGTSRRPRLSRLAPASYRRLILAACGSALTLPAIATTAGAHEPDPFHDRPTQFPSLTGLSLPDLPTSEADPDGPDPLIIRVGPGDSLWSIATELLGPRASSARIAAHVDDLYALNLSTIGPDPDLILPGTELTPPGGTS